jgi:hypothetical protein
MILIFAWLLDAASPNALGVRLHIPLSIAIIRIAIRPMPGRHPT